MTKLVPDAGADWFYGLLETRMSTSNFEFDSKRPLDDERSPPPFAPLFELYSRLALAVVDLEMDVQLARGFLAEAAMAGALAVRHEPEPAPYFQLQPFFALLVTGDKKAAADYAKLIVDIEAKVKRSLDACWQGMALAIAGSILDDDKLVARGLSDAAAGAKKKKRKPLEAAYIASYSELAKLCLTGKPTDLTSLLTKVARDSRAYFTPSIRSQFYEAYLAEMTLALLLRARARGSKLPKESPDPSLPFELLTLKPGKLPSHPWHRWPKPPADIKKRIAAALKAARK